MPASRVRTCLVSREERPEERLVRFVISPDGDVFPDVAAKSPGRGAWVEAKRDVVERAARKGLFARSAGRAVKAPLDLADRVEALLAQRCLAGLGLAKRAGDAVLGFDQVRALVKSEKPAYLIEASDGAADGRSKILKLAVAKWGEVPLSGCFSSGDLGAAFGTGSTTHAALRSGPAARRFAGDMDRLAGFRPRVPPDWSAGMVE